MRFSITSRHLVVLAGIVVLCGIVLSGCGDNPSSSEADGNTVLMADGINDGATPMVGDQTKCPVCGEPISSDVYTESKKKRVYFDKPECLDKWKADPEKYKKKLQDQKTDWLPPGGQA